MQLRGDALGGLLARAERGQPLPPVFVVASDEPLLALEAQDAIRAVARKQGYTEREVLQADGRFDFCRPAPTQRAFDEIAVEAAEQLRRCVATKMKMSQVVHHTSLPP